MVPKEQDYYPLIKEKFTQLFESKGYKVYLEITAEKKFSNKLKTKIPDSKHIIFSFLRDVAPDITGYIEKDILPDFVIIEVKNEEIKLDHIYQTKKYGELFEAKFTFLVSTKEIPEEVKRLSKVVYPLLTPRSTYHSRALVYYNKDTQSFEDWYPENPFEKEPYWR